MVYAARKAKLAVRMPLERCYNIALATLLVLLATTATCGAAVIRLKREVRCDAPLVRLGDVAQVTAVTEEAAERLSAALLVPAPAPGQIRTLGLEEIKEQLRRRAVNLVEHEFSGSNRVQLLSSDSPRAGNGMPGRLGRPRPTRRSLRLAEERLTGALRPYLKSRGAAGSEELTFAYDLSDEVVDKVTGAPEEQLIIRGGQSPWIGKQRFVVQVAGSGEYESVAFTAEMDLAPQVATARITLPRGVRIEAEDVELRRISAEEAAGTFGRLEEVIGKQTTRTVPAGDPLTPDVLQEAMLVRARDVVTVVVRGRGFTVKSLARAREKGALGQFVAVEPLDSRKQFLARVVGIREVEVPLDR